MDIVNQESQEKNSTHNFVWVLILLIIIVLVLVLVSTILPKGDDKPKSEDEQISQTIKQTEELNVDEVLAEFPNSAPIPIGAEIVRNLRVTSPEGRVQVTRQFTAPESMQESFDFLRENLQSSSAWNIISEVNESNRKAIFAQDENGILNISIRADSSGITLIDMSYLFSQ